MIDLRSVKQCYKNQELDSIAHVRTQFNPEHSFTKVKRNMELEETLQTGVLDHPVDQRVVREQVDKNQVSGDKKERDCQEG